MKRLLRFFQSLAITCGFALLLFPFVAFASSHPAEIFLIEDGSVIQQNRSPWKYLFFHQQKHRIVNNFTFRELGISPKDILVLEKDHIREIPTGDPLKITPPKIKGMFDMHEHFRASGNMDLYLDIAQKLGVEKSVFVPTGMGPDNAGYKDHMAALLEEQKKYPDRIIAFCTVDEADPEAPAIFEKCLDEGGKGLKLLGGHPEFYDTELDSDIVMKLFAIARDHDVPVMIHVSIINLPQAKEELKNLLNAFPEVRVQFAHYCSTIYNGINLDQCAEFLDAYPNLYIDLSMGGGIQRYFKYMTESMPILSGQGEPTPSIEFIKDFLLKYQDRIMYGTDSIIAPSGPTTKREWLRSRMMCDFSLLQEKWYRCPAMNKGEYALLPGFNFSEDVLRKIFVVNPKRFLKLNELAYPFDSLCSEKDSYHHITLTCGGQLSELPCDSFFKPQESLKDLHPKYPIIGCVKIEYEGEETSRGVTRILVVQGFTGEVFIDVIDYVIFKNGTFELISSLDDFQRIIAPIQSADQALTYITVLGKGNFIFDLAPLFKLKGGIFKVPKSDIKITSVQEDEAGFMINTYSDSRFDDCLNEVYEQVLFVSKTGNITQQERRLIWESKEKPRCIS